MAATALQHLTATGRPKAEPAVEETDSHWVPLFTVSAVAALVTVILIPIHVLVFIVWPPPLDGTALDWFELYQDNWFLGLLSMDLLLLVDYVLLIPIVLALYVALRGSSPVTVMLGAALFLVAIAAYFASNTAFEMMALSDQYAAAATETERAALLGAGEAMAATYVGTAFHVNYLLGSAAGILLGIAMLRTPTFGKAAAYAAIVGNVVGLGLYLPVIGLALSVISGPILWVWYILLARRFFRLRHGA